MDDRFDPAAHAEHARQVQDLASRARTAFERRLVDDGARLGTERDQVARRVQGAEHEKAAAKVQAQREHKIAAEADRKAAELERKATAQPEWNADREELREEAAQHRARAEVARRRAHAADEEVDRLEWQVTLDNKTVAALEAQLGSTDRMKAIESELDELDWQARNAVETATTTQRLADLERRIADADERGDVPLAAKLGEEATMWRSGIAVVNEVRARNIAEIDTARLAEIGIEIPVEVLVPPGEVAPAPAAPASVEPQPASDPTFDDATTAAPGATEPSAAGPTVESDIVTGELVAAGQQDAPAATDDPPPPVADQPPDAVQPAADVSPAEPIAEAVPDVATTPDDPQPDSAFDIPEPAELDETSFLEPEEPAIAERQDVFVDAG